MSSSCSILILGQKHSSKDVVKAVKKHELGIVPDATRKSRSATVVCFGYDFSVHEVSSKIPALSLLERREYRKRQCYNPWMAGPCCVVLHSIAYHPASFHRAWYRLQKPIALVLAQRLAAALGARVAFIDSDASAWALYRRTPGPRVSAMLEGRLEISGLECIQYTQTLAQKPIDYPAWMFRRA